MSRPSTQTQGSAALMMLALWTHADGCCSTLKGHHQTNRSALETSCQKLLNILHLKSDCYQSLALSPLVMNTMLTQQLKVSRAEQKHWHSHADTTHILWLASSHTHCSVMKHLLTYFMRAGLSFCLRVAISSPCAPLNT